MAEDEEEDITFGEELADELDKPAQHTPSPTRAPSQASQAPQAPQQKNTGANTGASGASFGKSIEDKFKLSLLQIERRFIDLETTVNEVNEKISGIDLSAVGELTQRMDDVEDLLMVEQAGILELKKMLEEQQEYLKKPSEPGVTQQQIKQWMQPLESRLQQRILSVEKRFETLPAQTQAQAVDAYPEEIEGLRARIDTMQNRLNVLENMKGEMEVLRGKIEPASSETLKAIMNEVSELRIETSREIREIKEKVGNAPLYADIQFLSNRVKDLKLTMDNLINMKVEIDAKILNLERMMAEGGGSTGAAGSALIQEVESTRKDLMTQNQKLGKIEQMMKTLSTRIESLHGGEFDEKMRKMEELENIYEKTRGMRVPAEMQNEMKDEMKQLRAEMQHAVGRMQDQSVSKVAEQVDALKKRISDMEDNIQSLHELAGVQPVATRLYDEQINELLQRIVILESRLAAFEQILERRPHAQSQSYAERESSPRPIILE